MKNSYLLTRLYLFLIFYLVLPACVWGYSLRQFSSRNGLSNSAIQALCQDQDGFMWFGSCDGLNRFDGLNIEVYKPTNEANILSGNLIENIVETEDGLLWIQTNYGLDLFDKRKKQIRTYKEFNSKNYLVVSESKDIYLIYEDNHISYFDRESLSFHKKAVDAFFFDHILDIVIDSQDILWIFTGDNKCLTYQIERRGSEVQFIRRELYQHPTNLLFCFHEGRQVYLIDAKYDLYEMNPDQMKTDYITNLSQQIRNKGEISSVIRHHNDFYIGFKSSGLIQLKETRNGFGKYMINEIDIRSGIFCMVKDLYQDVIWVGTDGQGVYMYYVDSFTLRSTPLNTISYQINNPVRALMMDPSDDLWIGTKGDGVIRVKEYDFNTGVSGKETEYMHVGNSLIHDNSVYAFSGSKRPLIWIGTEEGINYYSFRDKKIKRLNTPSGVKKIRYVHSISEVEESVLWVATVGEGVVKVIVSGPPDEPVVKETRRFVIGDGSKSSNYFFSSFVENDSIIWFGNRGFGALRFNTKTEQYTTYTFDKDTNNQILNDVFAITKNEDGYWFGTSFGLVRLYEEEVTVFNESHGFPNNTVHAILPGDAHELWLSTNQGVIKFNTQQLTFQTFREYHETAVTEFSDGAYYQHPQTKNIFFGGINGFLTIQGNEYHQSEYMPHIQFYNLSIFGKEYNIYDFLNKDKKRPTLELNYRQNFFAVSFTAIDYVNGNDYTWFYKLDELSNTWVENGNSGIATFTNISPGKYTLSVKYKNNITGKESDVYSLIVTIRPPWYQTDIAYLIYFVLILLGIGAVYRLTRKWYEMKKSTMIEKLTRQQKEEIYESKLRFFTNITHELCTPLTLIYGPCERIIGYTHSDGYVRKYAILIRQNVEKLNALIQELIEFRRLETGNMIPKIRTLSISDEITGIAHSFLELAESREIDYDLRIPKDISWNTDPGCLNKIFTNLISNAFKYTPDKGHILVEMEHQSEGVCIEISNTGKGIPEDRITEIFDRYKILDTFEIESKKGVTSRNGLGLAICHSMVCLLEGEIKVKSDVNGWTTFRVILPPLQKGEDPLPIIAENTIPVIQEEPLNIEMYENQFDHTKPTLMIVEDDPSMLWFITEIFVDKYNVIPLQDSQDVEDAIRTKQPDLVISDVMMPEIDGISLTRYIKGNKLLSHIPVILLSAKIEVEEQIKGIESGANVYITKPFNVQYLERIVERFLRQKDNLKEYYGSAASSYELNKGQLVHRDDKEIFDKIISIIDENINNPELNVELISSSLGISSRQLYRRIKSVTEQTPSDLIKEQKLKMAERLLISTNLSIDEIIYKAGYTNRGNFFRIFSAKYQMTPKQFRKLKKEELEGTK